MSPIHTTRCLSRILARGAVAGAIAVCTVTPGAYASTSPAPGRPSPADSPPLNQPHLPPGWNKHPTLPDPAHLHTALAAGLTGGQVTFIAAGTALMAASLLALWGRATRRRAAATQT